MADVIAASVETVRLDVVRSGPRVRASDPYPVEAASPLPGTRTERVPVALLPQRTYGASVLGRSVTDDYFDVIHVRPIQIDVGRLTSTVRREVEVWNAYLDSAYTIDDIQVTNADGINLFGIILPYTLPPLASVVLTLEVSPDGPATIDARYDLDFPALTQVPYFEVSGTRIIEWSIPPNWSDGFEESLAFKTEVIQAYDGHEQRIALRTRPRRSFAFTPLASGSRDRDMKRLLSTWQNRAYAMADWPRGVRCSDGAPPGAMVIHTDAPVIDLAPGEVIIVRLGSDSRVLETAGVAGTEITLNAPLSERVEAGSRVYRGLSVHAEPELSARRVTSNVGQTSMAFRELHISERKEAPPAEITWRGLEVFLTPPNWRETIDLRHGWPFEWVDSGRGAFDFRTPVDAPNDVRKYTFTARSRDEVEAFKAFFTRCRGRRGEFYMPTWDDDLALPTSVLASGDKRLPVEDERDADRLATERVYRNAVIRLSDGTRLLRQMYTRGDFPSGPGVLLDDSWPRDLYPGDVLAIHFLPRCRLASDEMVVRWLTDEVAEITLAAQVLPDIEVPQ